MYGRNNAARILVALGAMVLIAAALLHCDRSALGTACRTGVPHEFRQ
jgi:hypothetical protein